MGGQQHILAALPQERILVPIVPEAGLAPGHPDRHRKFCPQQGFDPQIIEPVVSRN
jgi:hypothetical protein